MRFTGNPFHARTDRYAESPRSTDIGLVLLLSGICGVYFGVTSGWQIAVESAQAVAGVVAYPPDNPFYMYHVKSWTLLHQIPAALLAGGCSEQVVSMLVACVPAVLGFQALALLTYAFGRDRLIASLIPVVLLAVNVCQDCGAVYPIRLISNVYWATYGVTGTNYVLFTWALVGVGLRRPAALLCGLAPAVHPALGGWCFAAIAAALICDWRAPRRSAASIVPWFMAGAAVTAISVAVQQYLAREVPPADPVLVQRLLEAFLADWDNHRFAFPLEHIEWRLGWCALTLFAVAHTWFADCLPQRSLLLLKILLVSSVGGLALCLLTHFSAWVPTPVMMAMPGRFINLAVVAFPAVLVGLLSRGRAWTVQGLLAGLMLFCTLRSLTLLKQLIYVPAAPKVFLATGLILVYLTAARRPEVGGGVKRCVRLGVAAGLLLLAFLERRDLHLAVLLMMAALLMAAARRWLDRPSRAGVELGLRAIAAVCLAVVVLMMIDIWLAAGLAAIAISFVPEPLAETISWLRGTTRPRQAIAWATCLLGIGLVSASLVERGRLGLGSLRGWDNDPVFAAAAQTPGLLLTVPRLGIAQLRSRRGLVLYGQALNQITYVPASGPAINRALKGIYDDDLLAPRPPGWVKCGGIMHDSARGVWERRQPEEWQRLAREFGFGAILTYDDWRLRLPVAARTKDLILYRVSPSRSSNSDSISAIKSFASVAEKPPR